MPIFNPRTFTEPDSLKGLDPELLLKLLGSFGDFLERHEIFESGTATRIDYRKLAQTLGKPQEQSSMLAETLYLIHEMANTQVMLVRRRY